MQRLGLITSPSPGGTFRVSIRLLRERLFIDDSEISNASSPTPAGTNEMREVPFLRNSKAYFVWLGFNDSTAAQLYDQWTNLHPGDPMTILDMAKFHVNRFEDNAGGLQDDWVSVMDHLGISQDLKTCIMAPDCEPMRISQSLRYWLIDTFNLRQRALNGISRKSVERKVERQRRLNA